MILGLEEEPVGRFDGTVADTSGLRNLLGRLGVGDEVGRHVDTGSRHRQRRSAGEIGDRGALLGQAPRDLLGEVVLLEAEARAVAGAQLIGARGSLGILVGVGAETILSGLGVALDEFLEALVDPADFLLGHGREGVDLSERPADVVGSAGNEDAAGDDGLGRFALEELGIVNHLEEMARVVEDRLAT